jgi:toxin-antitoxin system PIN domain toxin
MILPDANLLLYAYDSASPFHAKAADWWSARLSTAETVGLCPAVVFAFVRIATSSKAFAEPMTVDEAATHVESWMKQPMVQVVDVDIDDIRTALELLRSAGTGGNLTSDAQLAAVSLRRRAVVHTADSDFGRFPKVRWHNPILA